MNEYAKWRQDRDAKAGIEFLNLYRECSGLEEPDEREMRDRFDAAVQVVAEMLAVANMHHDLLGFFMGVKAETPWMGEEWDRIGRWLVSDAARKPFPEPPADLTHADCWEGGVS